MKVKEKDQEIEAIQYTGENLSEILEFCTGLVSGISKVESNIAAPGDSERKPNLLIVEDQFYSHMIAPTDWVLKNGPVGKTYAPPRKFDVMNDQEFKENFEPVENE